jgi:hypothetical protein
VDDTKNKAFFIIQAIELRSLYLHQVSSSFTDCATADVKVSRPGADNPKRSKSND